MFNLKKAQELPTEATSGITPRIRLSFDVEYAQSSGEERVNVYSRPLKYSDDKSLILRAQLAFQEAVDASDVTSFSATLSSSPDLESVEVVQEKGSNARFSDGRKVPATITDFALFEMVHSS